jgi:hypothetical protein
LCFPETLFKKKRKFECSVCKTPGHQKNNKKRCKVNEGYKTLYAVIYDSDNDDGANDIPDYVSEEE